MRFLLLLLALTIYYTTNHVALAQENEQAPFITTWQTDNDGGSDDNQIHIPLPDNTNDFDFIINWGDGNSTEWQHGDDPDLLIHTYDDPGTFTISISGNFPHFRLANTDDNEKLLTIEQWGDMEWRSFDRGFFNAHNLTINATDTPDLSQVQSARFMFLGASVMNHDMSDWDMSNIIDPGSMFVRAFAFNQDISGWDMSNSTSFSEIFMETVEFNQDIGGWDTSNANRFDRMFRDAESFNQDIGNWEMSTMTTAASMFERAESFNQDISGWDTSGLRFGNRMFFEAESFDQNLADWDMRSAENLRWIFRGSAMSRENIDRTIGGWLRYEMQQDVDFAGPDVVTCNETAMYVMENVYNWDLEGMILDDDCEAFYSMGSTSASFQLSEGEQASVEVPVTNDSDNVISVYVFDSEGTDANLWLETFPIVLTLEPGETLPLTLNVDTEGLEPANDAYAATLYFFTPDQEFEFDVQLDLAVSANEYDEVPDQISLGQNYPNPFNPATNITFTLDDGAEVMLEVFNTQGQLVAELANGNMAAGSHTLRFDGSGLASGVYLYRLTTGSTVITKKMMLLK